MKKTLALVLALIMAFSLSACGRKSPFASRAEIEAKLTNYKIAIEFTDEAGNKTKMTELRCDKGYIWIIGDTLLYIEYGTGKQYTLYRENKSGIAVKLDDEESYKTFSAAVSSYLFFHNLYIKQDLTNAGSEKVAGRKTNCYTFKTGDFENKFWVDDKYGITMKYIVKTEALSGTMEIKEFKAGGVKLTDMVNLSDYAITDLTE